MATKRVIEIESERSGVWWIFAGTTVGLVAGVLAAERLSGRPLRARELALQLRRLARVAAGQWEPLLDAALDVRDAWVERRAGRTRDEDLEDYEDIEDVEGEEDEDDEVEDNEDGEGEGEDEDDNDDELDLDDDLDDDVDDDLDDDAPPDDEPVSPIAERVLEAFVNDPVLAERSIEIDADDRGNVFLHGAVRTSREVAHAVTMAGGVPGVTAVRQRLRVRARR